MLRVATERVRRARTAADRATLLPLLVRGAVFLCAVLAVVVAFPAQVVVSRFTLLLLIAAAWPAVAPRGRGATVVAVLATAGWILDTTWYDQPVVLWRILALATTLYLGHTLTALAAVLPYDAAVNADVVTLWLARAFAVVLVSAVLTVVVLALTDALAGAAFLAATLIGLAAAVSATALLSWLLRRP